MEKIPTNRHERFSSSALFGLAIDNQSVLCGPCAGHHTCLLLEERMNSS